MGRDTIKDAEHELTQGIKGRKPVKDVEHCKTLLRLFMFRVISCPASVRVLRHFRPLAHEGVLLSQHLEHASLPALFLVLDYLAH